MKKTSLDDAISASAIGNIIDPNFDSARITGLQTFLDCLGDGDGIARLDDIDSAVSTSYFTKASRDTLSWNELQSGIDNHCFTNAWFKENDIDYLWPFVSDVLAKQRTEPEKYELLFLLIPDAIKAQEFGVTLRPEWLSVSGTSTAAYALHFTKNITLAQASHSPARLVDFIVQGSGSNPHVYTEHALAQVQKSDEVVVLGPLYSVFSSPQTDLGWGFGLERHDETVIHNNMANVVEAEINEQIKNGPIDLILEHHSAGLWQSAAWYNQFYGQNPNVNLVAVHSFGGAFGLSRTGGMMSSHGLTGMLRFFYFKNQKMSFSSAKTAMVTKMYAGGDEEMAQKFCDKGQGYGDLSWSAAAAMPEDLDELTHKFLESVLQQDLSLELSFAVNDQSVSVADALDALMNAVEVLPNGVQAKVKFNIYGIENFSDEGNEMSRDEIKRLRHVLQKHGVALDAQGQIDPQQRWSELRDMIVFHPGVYPGHFLINSTSLNLVRSIAG